MKRILPCLIAVLCLAACARPQQSQQVSFETAASTFAQQATETDAPQADTIIMATSADYPPFEFEQDGELYGADIQLARYLGKQLGTDVTIQSMSFDKALQAVAEGNADIAIAAIDPTASRAKDMLFSDSYYEQRKSRIVVRKADAGKFTTTASLTSVAVEQGGPQQAVLESTVPGATTYMAETEELAVQWMMENGTDAAAVSDITAKFMYALYPDQLALTDIEIGDAIASEMAVAVSKDRKDLLPKINEAIAEVRKLELMDHWLNTAIDQYAQQQPAQTPVSTPSGDGAEPSNGTGSSIMARTP